MSELLENAVTKQEIAQEEIAASIPGSYHDELSKLRLEFANLRVAIILALDPGLGRG